MMNEFSLIKKVINTALGKYPADLLLKNCNLVDVFTREIFKTNISIVSGRIASICEIEYSSKETLECDGYYAVPGLIDAHIHLDSTLLTPSQLAKIILPHGTTTVLIDPMEIANVLGLKGIRLLLEEAWKTPLKTFVQISSRVPTAPGLETTGATLGLKEVMKILEWENTIALGELDPSKVIPPKNEHLKKVIAAKKLNKIRVGHAAGLSGKELNAYIAAGLCDDHECVNAQEALERLRLGMGIAIREGSSERNLEELIKVAVEYRIDSSNLFFCTDDKHPNDIIQEGHIDYNVRKAIKLGLDPIKAIQIATINCAKHFRIDDKVGIIAPGRIADIILVKDLKEFKPEIVIANGEIVAKNGKFLKDLPMLKWPKWAMNTVKLRRRLKPSDFVLKSKKQEQRVRVIQIIEDQIINKGTYADLSVKNNEVQVDLENDILKIACVERHKRTGRITLAFVKGFNLKDGAIGSSVAHDHHNIVVVGTNNLDMAVAVNSIADMHGGLIVVKQGKVLEKLELPIAGLMSTLNAKDVIERLESLNNSVKMLGCKLKSPFMTLSFISLPTVPELGLTDKGLIDVKSHRIVDVKIE
ncbi:MAG: adenine deaminase [Candidatus Bathyarchaeia archaeon]